MISEIELTEALKELTVERLDIDLFGVAPINRLEGGPEGRRPTDYLPNAKSVLVCAIKIPDAAVDVAGHYEEPGKALGPYMWYGYVIANWNLSSAASRLPTHRAALQVWRRSRLLTPTCRRTPLMKTGKRY